MVKMATSHNGNRSKRRQKSGVKTATGENDESQNGDKIVKR